MKKHSHFSKLAALILLTTSLSLMSGCTSLVNWVNGDDEAKGRDITKVPGPRRMPELNPKGASAPASQPAPMVQQTGSAAAGPSAMKAYPKSSRETDPYDYYDMAGNETEAAAEPVPAAAPAPQTQAQPVSEPASHGSDVRKPLPANPGSHTLNAQAHKLAPHSDDTGTETQTATKAETKTETVSSAPAVADTGDTAASSSGSETSTTSTITPLIEPKPSSDEPVIEHAPTEKPAEKLVGEHTQTVTTKTETKVGDAKVTKVTKTTVEEPVRAEPPAETSPGTTAEASPLFLAFPKPPAQPQAAPGALSPASGAMQPTPSEDKTNATDDSNQEVDRDTGSHGGLFSDVASLFHGESAAPPDHSPEGKAAAKADYPSLSSVPEQPAEFQTLKSGQQQNMQDLKTNYDAAQQDKQQLDSEPSGQITQPPLTPPLTPLLGAPAPSNAPADAAADKSSN